MKQITNDQISTQDKTFTQDAGGIIKTPKMSLSRWVKEFSTPKKVKLALLILGLFGVIIVGVAALSKSTSSPRGPSLLLTPTITGKITPFLTSPPTSPVSPSFEPTSQLTVIPTPAPTISPRQISEEGENLPTTPAPSPPPVVEESIDQILSGLNFVKKDANFVNKGEDSLDALETKGLKILIPGYRAGLPFVKNIYAADKVEIHTLTFQYPEEEEIFDLAKKIGFTTDPTYPNPHFKREYRWEESNKQMHIWLTAGFAKINYQEPFPTSGDKPQENVAERIAREFVSNIGFDPSMYEVTTMGSQDANDLFVPVFFSTIYNDMPVLTDEYTSMRDGRPGPSWEMTVTVGPENDVISFHHSTYGQDMSEGYFLMDKKTLEQAINELKETGGVLRGFSEKEGFIKDLPEKAAGNYHDYYCLNNICQVKNASVTQATLTYYHNNLLPAVRYKDIDNNLIHPYDYLMPVWYFVGEGVVPKTNGTNIIDVPVYFSAVIPAMHGRNSEDVIKFSHLTLEKDSEDGDKVLAKFDFAYDFSETGFYAPGPRHGITYHVLVLYPDNTYAEFFDLKRDVYEEVLEIPTESLEGILKVYIELEDFEGRIAKGEIEL